MSEERPLVVYKHGGETYSLPGSKPEKAKTHKQTLVRTIAEELSRDIQDTLVALPIIHSVLADLLDDTVEARLPWATGPARRQAVHWVEVAESARVDVHDSYVSLTQRILDHLLPDATPVTSR